MMPWNLIVILEGLVVAAVVAMVVFMVYRTRKSRHQTDHAPVEATESDDAPLRTDGDATS